ncbi:hypothetical protein [Metasolibacillus sp. FSL K6-0083]|uniref:hypothetical protein n=1 Tax=Metasolibacillus sp. FSL K6-0083 TaxID=2921416 RepID=UPI00315A10D9
MDQKTTFILQQLAEGKTRQNIAKTLNIQWKSLDIYMRRRGFRWQSKQQTYILAREQYPTSKVQSIIKHLSTKNPDFKKISEKHGFHSMQEMGTYMQQQGYIWHPELNNYYLFTKHPSVAPQLTEAAFLNYLITNQQALIKLVTNANITSQTITTNDLNIALTTNLYNALIQACQKQSLTPQAIIELALKEYLQQQ